VYDYQPATGTTVCESPGEELPGYVSGRDSNLLLYVSRAMNKFADKKEGALMRPF